MHPINDRHAIVTFLKLFFFFIFGLNRLLLYMYTLPMSIRPGYFVFMMGKWINETVEEERTDNDLIKIGSIRCMDWDRKSLHWMDSSIFDIYRVCNWKNSVIIVNYISKWLQTLINLFALEFFCRHTNESSMVILWLVRNQMQLFCSFNVVKWQTVFYRMKINIYYLKVRVYV